jgi:hypothetical protein
MSATEKMSSALSRLVEALRPGDKVVQAVGGRPDADALDLAGLCCPRLHGTFNMFLPLPVAPEGRPFFMVSGFMVVWSPKELDGTGSRVPCSFLPVLPSFLSEGAASQASIPTRDGTGALPSGVLPRSTSPSRR